LIREISDGEAIVRGTGQPGADVQLLIDGSIVSTTTVTASGVWSTTVVLETPGFYQISVQTTDAKRQTVRSTSPPIEVFVSPPTRTPTPAVTATPLRTRTPTPTRTPAAAPVPGSLRLIAPEDGAGGGGIQSFRWDASFSPSSGQAFELVFWREGQNPMVSGFGLAAPTIGASAFADLDALDEQLGGLLEPGTYRWGILLVRESPYERIAFLGQSRVFNFNRVSGGGGDGSGGGGDGSGGGSSGESGGGSSGE
jgi:hypothetical protein